MGGAEAAALSKANSGLNFPTNIKTIASATIVQGPEDANLAIGQAVHFRAHYFGNPEPRVVWLKNGVRVIPSEDGGRISIKTYSGESTLIVRDLRPGVSVITTLPPSPLTLQKNKVECLYLAIFSGKSIICG
jgi:hypothetical protein